MCRLCGIKDIATQSRWPKPLEEPISDLTFLVDAAHEDWAARRSDSTIKDNTDTTVATNGNNIAKQEPTTEAPFTPPTKA